MSDYCVSCYKAGEQLCTEQSCDKYCLICMDSLFSQAINIVRCQSCYVIIPIWIAYVNCTNNVYNRYLNICITSARKTMKNYIDLGEINDLISIISEYKCITDSLLRLDNMVEYCNRSDDILTLTNRSSTIHAEGNKICNMDELLSLDDKKLYDKLIDIVDIYIDEPPVVNRLIQNMRHMIDLMLNKYSIGDMPVDFSYITKYISAITIPRLDICTSIDAALLLYPKTYDRSLMLLLRIEEILGPVNSVYDEMRRNMEKNSLNRYRIFLTNIVNAIDEL